MRVGLGDLVCCDDEGNLYDNGVSSSSGTDVYAGITSSLTQQGTYTPPSTTAVTSSASSPGLLTSIENALTQTGANLTKVYATRNAVPQLNPGESITQLANGTYQVTQNANGIATGASLSSGLTVGGISLPILLAMGVGVVFLMNKR